jgi:hypothetical protein
MSFRVADRAKELDAVFQELEKQGMHVVDASENG